MALYEGSGTEGRHTAAYLVCEVSVGLSREVLNVPAGSAEIIPGTVVAVSGADYAPFTGAEGDLAIAYSLTSVDATNAQPMMVTRHLTEVNDSDLVWPVGLTQPQKDAAIAAFKTNHVVVHVPGGTTITGALT